MSFSVWGANSVPPANRRIVAADPSFGTPQGERAVHAAAASRAHPSVTHADATSYPLAVAGPRSINTPLVASTQIRITMNVIDP